MIGRMMMMLLYLQRLGRCEECAGGNKPGKVTLKSKIGNLLKILLVTKYFKSQNTSGHKICLVTKYFRSQKRESFDTQNHLIPQIYCKYQYFMLAKFPN